jgi:iron complex transport system ATP-binding protein
VKNSLVFKNVEIGFINKTLINNFSASVKGGSIISVVGGNGLGKTCLLKTIAGIHKIKSGNILLNGQELSTFPIRDFAQNTAFVSTEKRRNLIYSVFEILTLGRSPYTSWNSHLKDVDYHLIESVAKKMKLENLLSHSFSELSDGQQQKVMIGRAIVQNPNLLILDEPLSFLDINSKAGLLNYFRELANEKEMIIIFSTHDFMKIKEVVNEMWITGENNLIIQGSPAELEEAGLIKKYFGLNLN